MQSLMANGEFWKALPGILWAALAAVVFLSAKDKIYGLLNRQTLTIKVAGFELSVADAAQALGVSVSDLQKRLSDLEIKVGHISDGDSLALGRLSISGLVADVQPAGTVDQTPARFSILWVDDNPSNNAFFIERFRSDGIDVETVLTTKQAMSLFPSLAPNLVITDLGRREDGISNAFAGLALVKQLRAIDQATPIVVFAGPRGIQNRDKLIAAGATAVFQSGVELQSLVSGLRAKTAS
jgi:CheY-like chemotaxis protein